MESPPGGGPPVTVEVVDAEIVAEDGETGHAFVAGSLGIDARCAFAGCGRGRSAKVHAEGWAARRRAVADRELAERRAGTPSRSSPRAIIPAKQGSPVYHGYDGQDTSGPGGLLPAYVDDFDPDDVVPLEVDQALLDAIPDNTVETVNYQWGRFVRWCGDQNREHLPPTIGTVRFYIWAHLTMTKKDGVTLCGRRGRPYAPATVETALGSIATVLQWRGYPSPWKHPGVRKQMAAYEQTWTQMGHTPDVAYVPTLEEHVRMLRSLDTSTCAGLRDAAMIALHGATGMRAGELVDLNEDDLSFDTESRMNVRVRWSKTKQPRSVPVEADPGYAPDVDAIALVNEYLDLKHARGIKDGRLFVQVKSGGRRKDGTHSGVMVDKALDRHAYEQIHARAAKKSGIDRDPRTGKKRHVVTHSERAFYITAASDAGMPAERIAPMTGHSPNSPVIFRYIRSSRRWGEHNPMTVTRTEGMRRRAVEEAE